MSQNAAQIEIRGLRKGQITALARQAKRLGMTPEGYAKQVLEDNLEIVREAQSKTFAEIAGSGQEVDEAELDRLVDEAKARHHRRVTRRAKR